MQKRLIKFSRCLELIFCIAFMFIAAVMLVVHKIHLGMLYLVLAALLSPLSMMQRLPSDIRFWVVMIGVFL